MEFGRSNQGFEGSYYRLDILVEKVNKDSGEVTSHIAYKTTSKLKELNVNNYQSVFWLRAFKILVNSGDHDSLLNHKIWSIEVTVAKYRV